MTEHWLVRRTNIRRLWIALALVWHATDGAGPPVSFLDFMLGPVRADRLARLFATILCIMAFPGGLFALGRAGRHDRGDLESHSAARVRDDQVVMVGAR